VRVYIHGRFADVAFALKTDILKASTGQRWDGRAHDATLAMRVDSVSRDRDKHC